MLEIRYDNITKEITGWCGDPKQFILLKKREGQTITILDLPIPEKHRTAYLFDEANGILIPNLEYIEPEPPRNLETEIDGIKARLYNIEKEKVNE